LSKTTNIKSTMHKRKIKEKLISVHILRTKSIQARRNLIKLLLIIMYLPLNTQAQTTVYNQLANEIQLTRSIGNKFALELFVNGTFSSTPSESQITKTHIQRGGQFWAHYYLTSRWKFTTGLTYYYNIELPEIEQIESTEWRPSIQAIYYINKIGYTLIARLRAEGRFFIKDEDQMDNSYRFRPLLKYLKPINSKVLRQGVFYAVASEELFLRTLEKQSGARYFDRNWFTIGPGYMVTDDLQLEFTYTHEFVPRDNGNTLNNLFAFTITYNNLISNIKKGISNILPIPDETE